jgi:hypothetical protein
MIKISTLICAASLVCMSLPATAANLFFEGGVHFGGDKLATAYSSSGPDQNLRAGQLLSMAVGMQTMLADSLQGRVSLGFKIDRITASNGNATFTRVPLEALLMHQSGNFMLGGGIAYHLSPKFDFNATPSTTVNFDDALGLVLGFDYNGKGKFEHDWYVGGRVTLINYKVSGVSISGNSIGAVIGYMF